MLKGNVNLGKLYGAKIHFREVDGEMMECISIPIKPNNIVRRTYGAVHNCYLPLIFWNAPVNKFKNIHRIGMDFYDSKTARKAMTRGVYERLTNLGWTKITDNESLNKANEVEKDNIVKVGEFDIIESDNDESPDDTEDDE